MLNILDLFAGIGGFSLGLERTGKYRTVAFCEQDKACQKVLKKHWPNVPIFDDVRTLNRDSLDGLHIDIITGGFPCQDISLAGHGAGLDGERSGLWYEFLRLIDDLRPQAALIENVSALRSRGLDVVLRGLASIGYDAEWHCIPASAVGAPHRRDRIWIIATMADASSGRRCGAKEGQMELPWGAEALCPGETVAYPDQERLQRSWLPEGARGQEVSAAPWSSQVVDGAALRSCGEWLTEPAVGRVAHGVPGRVDRLKQLGNAVVPQIPEMLGEALYDALRP